MINSELLKQRAKELHVRQRDIAERLGLKQSTVNQKINNVRPMKLDEAEKIADLLGISNEMFADYFFHSGADAKDVSQIDTSGKGKNVRA